MSPSAPADSAVSASGVSSDALAFVDRHVGPRGQEIDQLLSTVGVGSLAELVDQAVPASIRMDRELDLPEALSEAEVLTALRGIADQNEPGRPMIGQGFYRTDTPAVIQRNLLESPAWYTAYTPYQPEISQGRLELLLTYQTMVQDLTGLDIANASLLDESSAVVEAALLMKRGNRKAKNGAILVDSDLFPQHLAVIPGRARAVGMDLEILDLSDGIPQEQLERENGIAGVILQQSGASGKVHDWTDVIAQAKGAGAMATVVADLLALTLVKSPGEMGADISVGTSQRFGVPLFAGGPHAAFMAVRSDLQRSLPGRLVGVSHDDTGRPGYRLALQTREQHIRREKATSNICTAQALLAEVAACYAVYHGPDGLRRIARRVHSRARTIVDALQNAGIELVSDQVFDTVVARVPGRADEILAAAAGKDIDLRRVDDDHVGVSADERTSAQDVADVLGAFGVTEAAEADSTSGPVLPEQLVRTSEFLTHEVFNTHRSETSMMRWLRRLSDRDLALDRTMIPLGSCTMKLNAAVEMASITWPEFADVHPYSPAWRMQGWQHLVEDLESRLAELTGYAKVSIQPNAGSQGELAGLLAIRRWHISRGDEARDLVLIPASAHGTNAASAVLAGLRVRVVKTAPDGTVDHEDLDKAIADNEGAIAGIMITYPSTHGVFEEDVREVCGKIHDAGGQVYLDGANFNAMVGLAQPGQFGGDVSHLNLHKTFCIPHGGGGPGVGPVAVAEHLVPFLPGDPLEGDPGRPTVGGAANDADQPTDAAANGRGLPVTSTRWGSTGVLPISWAYLALMGGDGLTRASAVALLNANYIARSLNEHFPVLYTGDNGLVAHECILDLRKLTDASGIKVADVAKRLIDYGFHAPTESFPVSGTFMVEPTESEDKAEMDRFIEAMISIHAEIQQVIDGKVSEADSVVRHAPHTAAALVSDDWDRAYSRETAAFPVPSLRVDKYFPPIGRIDGAYGDRNLVCSCPPPEAFETVDETEPGTSSEPEADSETKTTVQPSQESAR
ncbi:aminomethyl-transferring glycine dehydrogenase [Kocuria sp. p3-SID1433]|uniref:aminomethyl-transferring glycine dehydrogenase n=1 Tax=unclassified Kocuria TaxID=2649579 RepID=UPI0021A94477|nr:MULTISPECIES: aminomethyl-transferring glycine dehydrogenase [unclassified Kocuria]MCT1602413.1 aminomethyl-transferring glycine dehydrogenase [Kocuria sp. p3-SID1428]MCT2180002.1 aminomethyl-transferring glycine dehydrogenase [Kocuria sp. p3-SID1433]